MDGESKAFWFKNRPEPREKQHPKQMVADEVVTELGKRVHQILNSPSDAGQMVEELNLDLDILAARIVSNGTYSPREISTREELDPEDQMAQNFWTTRSLLTSQVLAETIRTIAYFR